MTLKAFNSAINSADLAALVVVVEDGEADDLPVVPDEATEAVRRTGVAGVPEVAVRTERAVDAVGEVILALPFAIELVVERTEGTVVFRVREGLADEAGAVDVLEATEVLLVTPGVAVARVVDAVLVAALPVRGVLDARTELAVGLVAVEERTDGAAADLAVAVLVAVVVGVLEALTELADEGVVGFLLAPARPAAANEDIRLLTLGGDDSVMFLYIKRKRK